MANLNSLAYAANRASDRPGFVASVLKRYEQENRISRAALAEQLGCPIEILDKLALCRRPQTHAGLTQVAVYTGIDIGNLAKILLL